jgi:hypothetical protein
MPFGAVMTVQISAITTICTIARPNVLVSRDHCPRPMMCNA